MAERIEAASTGATTALRLDVASAVTSVAVAKLGAVVSTTTTSKSLVVEPLLSRLVAVHATCVVPSGKTVPGPGEHSTWTSVG
jgi:hypothetical protein